MSYCCPSAPPGQPLFFNFDNPYLDGFFVSVFYRPNIVFDLLRANTSLYPALVEMQVVISKLRKGSVLSTGNKTYDYCIAVLLLVFLVGGGSNLVASKWTTTQPRIKVYGFSSVIAASLAYLQRLNPAGTTVLFFPFLDRPVTAIGAYWCGAAILMLGNSNNYNRRGEWFPPLLNWLAAGFGGSLLAKYHVENTMIFGDLFGYFGWL